MLSVVSAQDLNKVQLSMSGELTDGDRYEHRAHAHVMLSVDSGSLKEGFRNLSVVRDIHHIINLMVSKGVIPAECKIGRQSMMGLSRFNRTALNTPVAYLWEHQARIRNWVEDNTKYNANDVFNALLAGAVIGASLGYTKTRSQALRNLYTGVRMLPTGKARTKLLADREQCLRLMSSQGQDTLTVNCTDVTEG